MRWFLLLALLVAAIAGWSVEKAGDALAEVEEEFDLIKGTVSIIIGIIGFIYVWEKERFPVSQKTYIRDHKRAN